MSGKIAYKTSLETAQLHAPGKVVIWSTIDIINYAVVSIKMNDICLKEKTYIFHWLYLKICNYILVFNECIGCYSVIYKRFMNNNLPDNYISNRIRVWFTVQLIMYIMFMQTSQLKLKHGLLQVDERINRFYRFDELWELASSEVVISLMLMTCEGFHFLYNKLLAYWKHMNICVQL